MTALGAKSHIPPRLTLLQKLQLLTRVVVSLPRLIFGITRDLLFNRDSASFRTIWMRNTARVAATLPLSQARALQRPSGCTIASLCKADNLRHETVELDAGSAFPRATLHFINCDPAARSASGNRNVLLYFHGGGYISPLSAAHFKFAHAAAQRQHAKCVLLEYTLAPELKYPGQLAQAAAALRYLLQDHDAADVTIAGDSAGGNLALGVLAHLREAHPLVRPVFELGGEGEDEDQQLRAVLCISPRCANECDAASYTYNASKDIVSKATMELFNSNWEPVKEEVWATPLAGTKEFWGFVHAKKALLLAGTDEVYVDDIRQFGELLGSSSADTELVLCAGEIHAQAISDIAVDYWDGVMLKVALNWLQNLGETR